MNRADQLFEAVLHFQVDNNRHEWLNSLWENGLIDKPTYDKSINLPYYQLPEEGRNDALHKLIDKYIEQGRYEILLPTYLTVSYNPDVPNYTGSALYYKMYEEADKELRELLKTFLTKKQ